VFILAHFSNKDPDLFTLHDMEYDKRSKNVTISMLSGRNMFRNPVPFVETLQSVVLSQCLAISINETNGHIVFHAPKRTNEAFKKLFDESMPKCLRCCFFFKKSLPDYEQNNEILRGHYHNGQFHALGNILLGKEFCCLKKLEEVKKPNNFVKFFKWIISFPLSWMSWVKKTFLNICKCCWRKKTEGMKEDIFEEVE
jgi:hypothetical protein